MDKTPIVQFFHNTACNNPGKTEIGDILLVSKLIRYGRLVEKRAIVIQSKFSLAAQMHWSSINTAQFYLVSVWPPFLRIKPKPLTGYNFHPQSLMWGTYAFVGPNATNYPIYQSPSRIFNQIPHLFSQKTFTFSPIRLYGLDMAPCFLMRLILCRIGENLLTNPNINSFVDELYRMTDLAPDPPNEFYWDADDNEEPPRGFGVVEFTISMERE